MTEMHKNLFYIVVLLLLAESKCYRRNQHNGHRFEGRGHRKQPEVNHFDQYHYDYADVDYSNADTGNYYKDYRNHGIVRDNREERTRNIGSSVGFSAFSQAEVSKALSMLTERELSQLSYLIDREEEHSGKRKRDCDSERCSEESDIAGFVNQDHVASIKGWFSRTKSHMTKAARQRTTVASMPRTTKRRSTHKPTHSNHDSLEQPGHLLRNDVWRYGDDRNTDVAVNRYVSQRIANLRRKHGKRNALHRKQHRKGGPRRIEPGAPDATFVSETQGTLYDSFPRSGETLVSLHDPLQPLIRVKREDSNA